MDSNTSELVARAASGDAKASDQLYRSFQSDLENWLRSRATLDPPDLDDLTQTVWMKVFRHLPRFRQDASFKTWLFAIAANELADHFTDQANDPFLQQTPEDDELEVEPEGPRSLEPDAMAERRELSAKIERTLDLVHPTYRSALILRDREDLTYDDIAQRLDLSLGATKTRIRRGRILFRQLFAGEMEVTDQELVKRAVSGDERSWTALYNRYESTVKGYLVNQRVWLHNVDDVAQDAWLRVVRSIGTFDPAKGEFLNWLIGCARHAMLDYLRRAKKDDCLVGIPSEIPPLSDTDEDYKPGEKQAPVPDAFLVDPPEYPPVDPESEARRLDILNEKIDAVLAQLPPVYETVIRGYYLDKKTTDELAAELGTTRNAIHIKLHRARKKIDALAA